MIPFIKNIRIKANPDRERESRSVVATGWGRRESGVCLMADAELLQRQWKFCGPGGASAHAAGVLKATESLPSTWARWCIVGHVQLTVTTGNTEKTKSSPASCPLLQFSFWNKWTHSSGGPTSGCKLRSPPAVTLLHASVPLCVLYFSLIAGLHPLEQSWRLLLMG